MFESIKIYKGEELILEAFIEQLTAFGYARKQAVSEEGDFSVKGDNVVIYPSTFEYPLRIEFENDRVIKDSLYRSSDLQVHRRTRYHNNNPDEEGAVLQKNIWREEDPIDAFVDMRPGDFVVHVDHGVGRYLGSRVINSGSGKQECLAIEYRDGDILYVNMKDIGKVQKYIYFQGRKPDLYKLGGNKWDQVKKRVEKGVFKVARDILDMQARRASMSGFAFSRDTDWQSEMESKFPFRETEDQKKAVLNVKQDMESTRPMDRLLCGDCGYGKTEVALRPRSKPLWTINRSHTRAHNYIGRTALQYIYAQIRRISCERSDAFQVQDQGRTGQDS
jgi:transcription-repair coupling factor (superfamily II helicase)